MGVTSTEHYWVTLGERRRNGAASGVGRRKEYRRAGGTPALPDQSGSTGYNL